MSDNDCLFCGIVAKTIPATIVYEDENVVAFRDVTPKAPAHILIIPREHIASAADLTPAHDAVIAQLVRTAAAVARQEGLDNGYRLVVNAGDDGGQTVHHLHVHLLGGRQMTWPPG